ncbi:MAG: AI-2E family transporter [Bdellovibrionales bacterium]|nr:AI-2E family transporter [Bdellovibrionales bacterium]
MPKELSSSKVFQALIAMAAVVVVVAGMRSSQAVLVPFVLSAFFAIMMAPAVFWLERKKLPTILAITLIIVVVIISGLLFGALVGRSLSNFYSALPDIQIRLRGQTNQLIAWLHKHDIDVPKVQVMEFFDPAVAVRFAATTFSELGSVLGNAFFIILTAIFMLLEASSFPKKLRLAFKNPEKSLKSFDRFIHGVKQYMAIKTFTSLMTGLLIGVWLWIIGHDYYMLWATLAFALNYVPNIGSIIAAVPAVLVALIQNGVSGAAATVIGYVMVNVIIGNLLEPRMMGRGLGLSTLVVFLSLVFWGWLWGPVGMLLSVPLTMIVKIAFESSDDTRWLSVLLDSEYIEA